MGGLTDGQGVCFTNGMETTRNYDRSRSLTKPGNIRVSGPCSRCGGKGGWEGWPGFTCYRCGGNCYEPNGIKVWAYPADWTDAQCAEHEAKRQERLAANREKRAAAKASAADAKRTEWVAQNPAAAAVLTKYADHDEFVADLARQLQNNGSLSERQIEVLMGKPAKIEERLARAAADAEREANAQPVPTGTETIEGEVLTTKWKDSQWGGSLKMLVLDDRGFKVWGTVPSKIDAQQGDRVRFTAAVEPSDDDRLFGFFSRPRKAEVLAVAEATC